MNLTTIAALPGSGAGCASAVRAEVNEPGVTPLARWLRQATDEELLAYEPGRPQSPAVVAAIKRQAEAIASDIVTRVELTGALDGLISFHP